MNLFYKPDRTTKPATVALYVLFALVCLLGLSKVLVYDLWAETEHARRALAVEEDRLSAVMAELADYSAVKERYSRYAATEEERALIDRMDVLALVDRAMGGTAKLDSISISGDSVQLQFSGVTLAQTAQIVYALENAPIVAGTEVTTAATTQEAADSGLVQTNVRVRLQKEAET